MTVWFCVCVYISIYIYILFLYIYTYKGLKRQMKKASRVRTAQIFLYVATLASLSYLENNKFQKLLPLPWPWYETLGHKWPELQTLLFFCEVLFLLPLLHGLFIRVEKLSFQWTFKYHKTNIVFQTCSAAPCMGMAFWMPHVSILIYILGSLIRSPMIHHGIPWREKGMSYGISWLGCFMGNGNSTRKPSS